MCLVGFGPVFVCSPAMEWDTCMGVLVHDASFKETVVNLTLLYILCMVFRYLIRVLIFIAGASY